MHLRSLSLLLLLITTACGTPPQHSDHVAVLVRFQTDLGEFTVALAQHAAPISCANFLKYVEAGRYNGGQFHRSVRLDNQNRSDVLIEVIQAGARDAPGQESFPPIALERTRDTHLRHLDGTISMARGGINSATSDFFICIGEQPSLDFGGPRNADGQGFAAFGQVVQGMDVIRAIHQSPTNREQLAPTITIQFVSTVPGQ